MVGALTLVNRAEASTLLEPGTIVGRYELVRRLEIGGMAEIYLARALGIEGFEKQVVLKRILPHHATRREFVDMFLDEARMAAALQHPNIAQVYDIGNDPSGYFFTMEYVVGKDLRHVRRAVARTGAGERIPMEHAVAIILGAAAGLHSAHEARRADGRPLNIVHRDVSPANILITFDGCVKLIDFGIAKAAFRQTETRSGVLKGKSSFMSPEQCLGEQVDRRSDVFSLGILLYELTTGCHAFRGRSAYDTMTKIAKVDYMPPALRVEGYPRELEQIVGRALQRDPDDRYATAQEMFMDLDAYARSERLPVSTFSLGAYIERLFPEEGTSAVVDSARTSTYESGPVKRPTTDVGYPRAETTPFEREAPALLDDDVAEEILFDISGELDDFGGLTIPRDRAHTVDVRTPAPARMPTPTAPTPMPVRAPTPTRLEIACEALVLASAPRALTVSPDSVSKPLLAGHRMESESLTSVVARPDISVDAAIARRARWWIPAAIGAAALAAIALLVVLPMRSSGSAGADGSDSVDVSGSAVAADIDEPGGESQQAELLAPSAAADDPAAAEPMLDTDSNADSLADRVVATDSAATETPKVGIDEPAAARPAANDRTRDATPAPRTRGKKRAAPAKPIATAAAPVPVPDKTPAPAPKRIDLDGTSTIVSSTLPDLDDAPAKPPTKTAEAAPAKNTDTVAAESPAPSGADAPAKQPAPVAPAPVIDGAGTGVGAGSVSDAQK